MKERPGEEGEERSQFYLLRVWTVVRPGGEVVYQGKLHQVVSDGSYFFASTAELLALIESLFPGTAGSNPGQATPPTPKTEER